MNFRLQDSYWHRTRSIPLAQASKAEHLAAALRNMPGVEGCEINNTSLMISYDLRAVNLAAIEAQIVDHGVARKHSLWQQFKYYLARYREAIVIAEENIDYGWDVWVQDAYVSRYRLRRHGRRDDRVTNWRMYEQNTARGTNELAPDSPNSGPNPGDQSDG